MTHEELLDKIKNRSELEDCWMALQKVVELHKQSGGGSNFCYACSFELEIPYPCPTIQAIQEQLK